ncbi:MAG: recombination factor protein RarA, partial [Planctomycetota bacterium]
MGDDVGARGPAELPPLAERMRPRTLEQFLGQDTVVGAGRALRAAIEQGGTGSL